MRQLIPNPPPDPRPVCAALDAWLQEQPALRTLAVFAALPGEVCLLELIARHPEIHWTYPRVLGTHLFFHSVKNPQTELRPGNFGIAEPSPTLPEIPASEIDAFLCPGLAFDASGGRLGRGKGFYDRILATARPGALKIGVCFPGQLVPDTFSEPHDVRMDRVISG
jgi:5-formyltetrahydrofolate cyclo-ligase